MKTDKIELKAGERIDDLQRNGLHIIQDPKRFCFGMDAVLLSGYAHVKKGGRALDLGCGNGIIPILLSAKTEGKYFAGLEIQHDSADMAQRSVLMDELTGRVEIFEGDIKNVREYFKPASFDTVTSNPPYMINRHGLKNPGDAKAIARHEILCTLDDVTRSAADMLKPGGHFYMVHRPSRLEEIILSLKAAGLTLKRMRMVYPYADREPNMVLLDSTRGGNSGMRVDSPLVIYKEQGVYTDEVYEVYGY